MDEQGNKTILELLRDNWWFLIIVFIFFFYKGKWGNVIYDKAQFYSITALFIMFAGKMFYEYGKYQSPQLIWYKGNASINSKDYKIIGDYMIWRLGGIDWGVLSMPGNEGTLIAPRDNYLKIGDGWACNARMQFVNEMEVPQEIRRYILSNNFPTKKILMGYYAYKMEMKESKLIDLEQINQEQNRTINKIREISKGNLKDVETMVGFGKRVSATNKPGFLERLRNRNKEEEQQQQQNP